MRYFVSIDLDRREHPGYSFRGTEIADTLTIINQYTSERYIKISTAIYDRSRPGLVEKNWSNPFHDDPHDFVFLAGYVLYRNKFGGVSRIPDPKQVLQVILDHDLQIHKALKGNYYILHLAKDEMKVSIYSSPMFMYPAFYSFLNKHLIFSNHLESFKNYIPITLDEQGMLEFSLFDHTIHGRTLYREIKEIPGGHVITFRDSRISEECTYDVTRWYTPTPQKKKESLAQINEALKTALIDYVDSTDKFNISLTGGFDGRLDFSLIPGSDYRKLRAFSYGKLGSTDLSVPQNISKSLGFKYEPIYLESEFEGVYSKAALAAIFLTSGISGFNRAIYPYAYNIVKDYSRSCIVGQCDMIRPLYNNPAGVIFNEFSNSIFFSDYHMFRQKASEFSEKAFLRKEFFTEETLRNIYDEITERYIQPYPHLDNKLRFYFFLLKESLMKYWHTEFHLVSVFVDDFVPFSDLDYLESLFGSEYAGIYKGLLVKHQIQRWRGQDLYVDLMKINNDRLNYFFNDRYFKPGWLKYGFPGWLLSGVAKKIGNNKRGAKKNDTFDAERWSAIFYKENDDLMPAESGIFNADHIRASLCLPNADSGMGYRLNRSISQMIWFKRFGVE